MAKPFPSIVFRFVTPLRAMMFCCLFMAGLIASKWSPDTGFTALLGFGERWDGRRTVLMDGVSVYSKRHSGGADAQWYVQVALDPTLMHPDFDNAARFIDWPSYRARRIGMPAVSYALGAGNPALILNVFALINVFAWGIFAYTIWRWLRPESWFDFARWFVCCFGFGAVESLRNSLSDLPALMLLLAPVIFPHAFVGWSRGVLAIASVFVKETSVLGFFALPWAEGRRGFRLTVLTVFFLAVIYGAWLVYLYGRLGGTAGDTANFTWPLVGVYEFVRLCIENFRTGPLDSRFVLGLPTCLGLLFQCVWVIRRWDWKNPLWRLSVSFTPLALFMGLAVWGGPWHPARALLPVSVGFCLLYDRRDKWGWLGLFLANVGILHGIIRFL